MQLRRAGEAEVGATDAERFQLELEFLQCLANPHYLNWLAQNRFFEDKAFINYLAYLQYWKQPQYAKFIIYPHALHFLDLLQTPEFRVAIANPAYKEHVHSQQFFFWQHFRSNRLKELQQERQQQQQGVAQQGEGVVAAQQGTGAQTTGVGAEAGDPLPGGPHKKGG